MASLPRRHGRLGPGALCLLLLAVCCWVPATLGSADPLSVSSAPGRRLQASCDQTTYQALTPTITRAPVVDLKWLDAADQKIVAITKNTANVESGGLWTSPDGGRTWLEQTGALNATVPKTEVVEIVALLRKKSSPSNVVALGAGSWYWTSNNFGQSFTSHQTPTKWRGMSINFYKEHPSQEDWLLLLVKRPGCRVLDRAQMQCPQDLMYTSNLYSGNPTWVNLTEKSGGKIAGFVDFDWARNLCPKGNCKDLNLGSVKDETILATMYAKPGDYDQPWDPDVHFVISNTWFDKFNTRVRCGNMFEVIGSTVYLAMANSCPTDIDGNQRSDRSQYPQGISLYTSTDGGNSFTQACMPSAIKQEGYDLLETHDSTGAIVMVDYVVSDMPASSVYTAGPQHALFSLSLSDVFHRDYSFDRDFARVEGLPGVYIANQALPRPDAPGSDYYDLSDLTGPPLVETRITFNGGARWQRIPAPTTFNFPACNWCSGQSECYLHLHGPSEWNSFWPTPAIYSHPSAPGTILASGNVGMRGVGLDDNDGTCTWMSTDGGVTWRDVAIGTYIYEFADWGGFVVMGRHPGGNVKAADEILFSYDGGQCWNRVPLSEALFLDNIRIEPDGQRPRVVLHGTRCSKSTHASCYYSDDSPPSSSEGLIYMLDLQDLLGRRMGQCSSTDRELWGIPSDQPGYGTRCVLGRQSLMQRRRFNAACFNGPDYVRPAPLVTPCNCNAAYDLECDYRFMRIGADARCQPIPPGRMPSCPIVESGRYMVSSTGKRLVHGDTCLNVAAVLPDTDGQGKAYPSPRRPSGSKSGSSGWTFFGIFKVVFSVLVLGGGFVAWWIFMASETQRDTVRDLASGASELVTNAKGWFMEKISGKREPLLAEHDLGYFQPIGDQEPGEQDPLFTIK